MRAAIVVPRLYIRGSDSDGYTNRPHVLRHEYDHWLYVRGLGAPGIRIARTSDATDTTMYRSKALQVHESPAFPYISNHKKNVENLGRGCRGSGGRGKAEAASLCIYIYIHIHVYMYINNLLKTL